VQEVAVPAADPTVERQTADGTVHLLLDEQRSEATQESFEHDARKFTSPSGVQDNARVAIDFAPAYQKLTLHRLVLHRNGLTIDRLPTARIRMLDREEGMDNGVYNGFITAAIEVEDVRIGDTLEYSFTTQGDNPVFAGTFSDFIRAQWMSPVARFSYRLLWPKGRYLAFKPFGRTPQPVVTEQGATTEYRWTADTVPAAEADGDTPSWYSACGWIQLSGYRDWASVVNWALGFYTLDDPLPPKVRDEVERLRKLDWEEDRILGALEYVQNNIRYVSDSEGVHSHRPYPIAEVVGRGFGDCKDKARLLAVMLRALGFQADPALVNTDYHGAIADWLPSPTDFDHAIVALQRDGRRYWLDATRDHQRGNLADRYVPDFGQALVIRPGEATLTAVAPFGFHAATVFEENTLHLPASHEPVEMTIRTTFGGRRADRQRYELASNSLTQIARNYLNFAVREYPGATALGQPVFHDDPQRNVITADERYRISNFWQPNGTNPGKLYGEVYASLIGDQVANPSTQVRTAPLAIDYPRNIRETFTLHLPVDGNFPPEATDIDDPAFRFHYSTRYAEKDHVLTLVYEYHALADSVPPGRMSDYLAHIRRVRDILSYSITLPKHILDGDSAASATSADAKTFAPNWTLLFILILFTLLALAAAVVAYRWRPQWPPRPAHPRYCGLQGWLLLVGFGLLARPIYAAATLFGLRDFLDAETWNTFTVPGRTYYDALWAPALTFESFVLTSVLISSALLIVLFLQRRRTFPVFFVWVLGAIALSAIIDVTLVGIVAKKFPALKFDTTPKEAVQVILQAMIWIPYMLVSQRVRATFVK